MIIMLCLMLILSAAGCGSKTAEDSSALNMANPWKTCGSLKDAEELAGFELGMPEQIAGSYRAEEFSVMNGELTILQVVYRDDDITVTVRKAPGAGQDISGVYGFEKVADADRNGVAIEVYWPADTSEMPNASLTIFDLDGYSWSLYAPKGYWGDSCDDFLRAVFG